MSDLIVAPEVFIDTLDAKKHSSKMVLLSSLPFADGRDRSKFLEDWLARYPQFVPARSGEYEPFPWKFDADNPASFTERWSTDLYWRSKKPRTLAHIACPLTIPIPNWPTHSSLWLRGAFNAVQRKELVEMADHLASKMAIDFGIVHHISEYDVRRASARELLGLLDPEKNRWMLSLPSHAIRYGLPDVFWKTYFGPPYVEMMGEALLLSAPAFEVSKLDQGIIAIQLTESLDDCLNTPELVDAARNRLIDHLGAEYFNSFYDPMDPRRVPPHDPDHPVKVPKFRFSPQQFA